MLRSEQRTALLRRWPWWRGALTGLSALALGLSTCLSWHYLRGGSLIGCSGGSPCDEVLSSRWSAVGGVLPVSGLAAGTYLAIFIATLFIGPATSAPDRRLAWGAILIFVGAVTGSAIWFTVLQKWIIRIFCPYCVATHATGVLLTGVVIWRVFHFKCAIAGAAAECEPPIGRLPAFGLTLIGLTLAGIMATCQLGFAPRPVYRAGASQIRLPATDPHAVPLVGSPDALYVVTVLFDYQCPHCQKIHSILDEAIRLYDGKLAFALCPAPLNSQCNPYVARDVIEFKDSCELARVALAVWTAKREAFGAFDGWMFSAEPGQRWHPRSLDAATAKAVELVGQANFKAARADPWIDTCMQTSIRIYGDTLQSENAVPKLVFGSRWVTPQPRDAGELVSILQDQLGVPRP